MTERSTSASSQYWIAPVFFLSGAAAILYQLIWQRTLFALFGINVQSVTIVVTAFMLGLGLGSLLGGALSRWTRRRLLVAFAVAELGVGAFGLVSLALFHRVGMMAVHLSNAEAAFTTFLILLLPTVGMGATLPLLVAYLVGQWGNVGWSVGTLYAVNTFGSAIAAFAGAAVLLRDLGQQGVVHLAVGCNVVAAVAALAIPAFALAPRRE